MFFSGLHTILHTLVIYEMFVKTDKHFENCNGNHLLGIPIEGKRESGRHREREREGTVFLYNNCIHSPQLLVRPSCIKLLLTLLIINFIELCLSFVCVCVPKCICIVLYYFCCCHHCCLIAGHRTGLRCHVPCRYIHRDACIA